MGSSTISNNLYLVKSWAQQTDYWHINNVGMIWNAWKNGHNSPKCILMYFWTQWYFGNTKLSFSCRRGESPEVQGPREQLRVVPNSHFNIHWLMCWKQLCCSVFCYLGELFNHQWVLKTLGFVFHYPDNVLNNFCALDLSSVLALKTSQKGILCNISSLPSYCCALWYFIKLVICV